MEGKIWGKSEERKQLERIRALIEETDEGSYIRMTFAGVCDICAKNIDNDFGDAPVADFEAYKKRIEKEDAERGARIVTLEHERDTAREYAENLESRIFDLEKLLDAEKKISEDLREENAKLQAGVEDLQEKLKDRDAKIVSLKAEIYDWERS